MELYGWAIFFFAAGIILLIAEILLPTHGVLGVIGVAGVLVSVGVCFAVQPWLGVALLATCIVAAPVAWSWAIRIWPKTPVGRKILLAPVASTSEPCAVQIGQEGTCITELRPVGVCEFDGVRMEAISQYGIISRGQRVRVVDLNNRRPVVRVVQVT